MQKIKFLLTILLVSLFFSCKENGDDNVYNNGGGNIIECKVSVKSNGNGSVKADKSVINSGDKVTLTANAHNGYVFRYWILDDKIVSINNIYSAKIEKDSEFKAFFQKKNTQIRYVNLGLSVKWADCNIGAASPEGFGDYFAWGEIAQKSSINYFWDTYIICNGRYDALYGYNFDATLGRVDNKEFLEKEDDAAYSVLGENWRLPSKAEFEELREKCEWEWSQNNGVDGYTITGVNGNSIFLPVTGYFSGVNHVDSFNGNYWSNQVDKSASNDAFALIFSRTKEAYIKVSARRLGLPVRAVWRE